MIGLKVEGEMIVITMSAMVSEADWEAAVLDLDEKLGVQASIHLTLATSAKLRLLMDWEKLEGWQKGARSTCTWFCMGNHDLIDRLALIGPERWREEAERLADIYKNAKVGFYPPAQREHALRWLKQADE